MTTPPLPDLGTPELGPPGNDWLLSRAEFCDITQVSGRMLETILPHTHHLRLPTTGFRYPSASAIGIIIASGQLNIPYQGNDLADIIDRFYTSHSGRSAILAAENATAAILAPWARPTADIPIHAAAIAVRSTVKTLTAWESRGRIPRGSVHRSTNNSPASIDAAALFNALSWHRPASTGGVTTLWDTLASRVLEGAR